MSSRSQGIRHGVNQRELKARVSQGVRMGGKRVTVCDDPSAVPLKKVTKHKSKAILNEEVYKKGLEYEKQARQHLENDEIDAAIANFINACYAILQNTGKHQSRGSKRLAKNKVTNLVFQIEMAKITSNVARNRYRHEVIPLIQNTNDNSLKVLLPRAKKMREQALSYERNDDDISQTHKYEAIAIHLYQQTAEIYMWALKQKLKNDEQRTTLMERKLNCLDRLLVLNTSVKKKRKKQDAEMSKMHSVWEQSVVRNTPTKKTRSLKKLHSNSSKKATNVVIHTIPPNPTEEKNIAPLNPVEEKNIARRIRISQEIQSTEDTFVQSLAFVVECYINPLRKCAENASTSIISTKQIDVIFTNLETIYGFNQTLEKELNQRFELWGDTEDTQCIGDVFLKYAPYFKMYSDYVQNYDESSMMVKSLEKNSAWCKFNKTVSENERSCGLKLPSFLIMPIQRIPRYKMLLSELLKYTSDSSKDYKKLTEAVKKVGDSAAHINEAVRAHQNRIEIRELEMQFSEHPNFVAPHRVLIRWGEWMKKETDKNVLMNFFLFNDMIAYASTPIIGFSKFGPAVKIPIDQSFSVQQMPHIVTSRVTRYFIQIRSAQESFEIYTEDEEQCQDWVKDFSTCVIDQSFRRISTVSMSMSASSEEEIKWVQPVWQQDSEAAQCKICAVQFSVFTRRHHCRKCGKLVCQECSLGRMKLGLHGKFARVCDTCKPASNSGEEQKVWQDDDAGKDCSLCHRVFTTFNRKHHCRKCGILVCNSCSLSREVADYSQVPQRVCDKCTADERPERAKWQADNSATECTICQTEFTTFNRRHHCRKCGLLVCGGCSPSKKVIYPDFSKVPERVCTSCYPMEEKDGPGRQTPCPCCVIL